MATVNATKLKILSPKNADKIGVFDSKYCQYISKIDSHNVFQEKLQFAPIHFYPSAQKPV
jgi:hypothetical protein